MTAERAQSRGEEVANSLSHGIGFLLAVASLPILVHLSAQRGGRLSVVGVSLFCATMILLYLVSALYHALPAGRAKHWFNRLDHAAIYLFIAGSYMPYLQFRFDAALRALRLAPVRAGGHRLPRHRGGAADRMTRIRDQTVAASQRITADLGWTRKRWALGPGAARAWLPPAAHAVRPAHDQP